MKKIAYSKKNGKVILLHDNAPSYTAKLVKDILKSLRWDILSHPPYSLDLAPSDYHLFASMGHALAEQHFSNFEEVGKWLDEWFAAKDIRKCPDNARSFAFSQPTNCPRLIEDETFNGGDITNNLIDYEDGQEEPDSLRADKMHAGIQLSNKLKKHFFITDANSERNKPGLTHVLYHEIDTGDQGPVVSRPYRYDRVKQGIIDYHVHKMLKEGPIRPIQSPYASPVVLTRKNNGIPPDFTEAYRFAIDYRKLNTIT
ncbi:mariner Mos1 transposase [Trichonephila clavipes]|nr:mariner Mos1 transposase [Trichonephila clavipes]